MLSPRNLSKYETNSVLVLQTSTGFLQLRDYLLSHKEWDKLRQPPTPLESLLIKVTKEGKGRETISQIYHCLQSLTVGNTLDIKGKWELEINVTMNDEEWEEIVERGHKITNNPLWKEFSQKLNLRYFRIPFIVSKFDVSKTNLCWRDCKQISDHTHIFWDCPKLKMYWCSIHAEIQ